MINEKRQSSSYENTFTKNTQDFKFRRQTDRALTNINSGKEIWYFKNEILKDIKNLEKTLTDKFNSADLDIKDEIKNINENINSFNIKLKELATKITEDNSLKEKVNSLDGIKNKILDNILVNDMKVNTLDREIRQSIINMNNTLKESVIYAGVIGPSCKFKTFHDLIDFIINELSVLGNFKEKNMLDLDTFKKKIENNVNGFRMQLDSFGRSSTQFTTDNFNKIDKTMHELFHQTEDKIDEIKTYFEEKSRKTDKKIDDVENKLIKEINEIKNKISSLEKNMNSHIKHYLHFKEDMNKLNENMTKRIYNRGSTLINVDNNSSNNNLNKNRNVKRRKSIINNEKNEALKNNDTNDDNINKNINDIINNNINNNIDNNKNDKENEIQNISSEEDIKKIKAIKKNITDVKSEENNKSSNNISINNLNQNLKINVENSNSFDLNKYIKEKSNKRKEFENTYIYGKTKLILSRLDQENERMRSFSPKRKSIKIKNVKQTFNVSKHSNSNDSSKSKKSMKTMGNANNLELIKPMKNLKESQNKKRNQAVNTKPPITGINIFNKNIKVFQEQNKLWLLNKDKRNLKRQNSINDINSLNLEYNNMQNLFIDRNNYHLPRATKSSTKFKNIILTLEGTKKMVYESQDYKKGKNIYHIESLSEKNGKKSYLRERLESCRSFLVKKNYKKSININSYYQIDKEEPFDFIHYKNKKVLLMNKSASSRVYLKKKHTIDYEYNNANINNNFSPPLSITKYNFPKKTRYKTSDEKSLQTDKNYVNNETK